MPRKDLHVTLAGVAIKPGLDCHACKRDVKILPRHGKFHDLARLGLTGPPHRTFNRFPVWAWGNTTSRLRE